MDFFEHQDTARRNTSRLILLFALAVGGIVLMIYFVVMLALAFQLEPRHTSLWEPRILFQTTVGVLLFVWAGSAWKMRQLGKGGAAVAARIGGRRLDPASPDPIERRILNVVEEMAIASGTPVPPVYLLDEERGINAFAAGNDPADAVIGITRGAVEKLSRDELQGVVAHEFSHILHGDMRLNLQLIGIIYGIELIAHAGRLVLHGGSRAGRGRRGRGAAGALVVGGTLMIIGSVGSLCGKLIRAAVSKQREFLADAAAVQFTRNASGITGALKKIGGYGRGSHLGHPGRAEVSHMFFGSGVPSWDLGQLFATHPPIEERIRRVEPTFDGYYEAVPLDWVEPWVGEGRVDPVPYVPRPAVDVLALGGAAAAAPTSAVPYTTPGGGRLPPVPPGVGGPNGDPARPSPGGSLLDVLGEPRPEHLAWSRDLLEGLPAELGDAARDLRDARALSYALFGSDDPAAWEAQRRRIEAVESRAMAERARVLRSALTRAGEDARIPLSEILTGTLRSLHAQDYEPFRRLLQELAGADGELDLGEWVLAGLVLRHLDAHFGKRRPTKSRYSRLSGLEGELAFVLSALAHAANPRTEDAREAFEEARRELALERLEIQPAERLTPRVLEASLDRLAALEPQQKKRVLSACSASIAADAVVTAREAELFRVVADWLEVPAPPLLPGQRLA